LKKTLALNQTLLYPAPDNLQALIHAAVQAALGAQKPTPLVTPELSVEALRDLLVRAESKRANDESQKIVVSANPPDLRHLPPPGERSSVAVQAPAKVWGDPRWLKV